MLQWIKSSGPLAAAIVAVIAMLSLATYASHERQQRERPEYTQQREPVAESAGGLATGVNADAHAEDEPGASSEQEDATPWIVRFFSEINVADSIIALFTVVLAWSTMGLWRETQRLAQHADSQAKEFSKSVAAATKTAAAAAMQAKAALLQAEAMIEAERGYLVPRKKGHRLYKTTATGEPKRVRPGELSTNCYIQLRLRNSGKTRITIDQIALSWRVGVDVRRLPKPIYFSPHEIDNTVNWTIDGSQKSSRDVQTLPLVLKQGDILNIRSGETQLWVCGRVQYYDMADTWHVYFARPWEEFRDGGLSPRGFLNQASIHNHRAVIGPTLREKGQYQRQDADEHRNDELRGR